MVAVIVDVSKWRNDKSLGFLYVPFDWRVPDSAVIYLYTYLFMRRKRK